MIKMVEAKIYSTCGKVHDISSRQDNGKIVIDVDTPCKAIEGLSHMEIPMDKDLKIGDNPIIEQANCCYACMVPAGILNVCGVEKGYWDESNIKEARIGIEF